MFELLMSHNLARSTLERETNGLAYSKYPANANDLATPLARGAVGVLAGGEEKEPLWQLLVFTLHGQVTSVCWYVLWLAKWYYYHLHDCVM